MKPILIAAALIAVLGALVGAVSRGPSRPLHDELRWTESASHWSQSGQPRHERDA
jgi:hypothetical protein